MLSVRRRVWFSAAAVFSVVVLAGCAGIESADEGSSNNGSPNVVSVEVSPVGTKAPQTAPGIGVPARDGKFEFVVTSLDRSKVAGNPDNQFEQATAQGEFINVHLTVKNIGDEAQSYFASNQKLIVGGKRFDAESILGIPGDMQDLNPGLSIETVVSFDVPPGSTPEAIELHDSMFSGGVEVKLS